MNTDRLLKLRYLEESVREMKQYKIGDKLKCIKDANTTYFEMTNPRFVIPKDTIVAITGAKVYSPETACYFLLMNVGSDEMKKLNPEINFPIENIEITAWNDEGSAHIDEYFQLI